MFVFVILLLLCQVTRQNALFRSGECDRILKDPQVYLMRDKIIFRTIVLDSVTLRNSGKNFNLVNN